jgi:uncharacterized membrane protein
MTVNDVVEPVGRTLEVLGVATIALGASFALAVYLAAVLRGTPPPDAYAAVRRRVGLSVLLGLEILVAGDIIRTVAVDPTLTSIAVLAGIVGIRTFLSVTIDTEVNGRWPWSRGPDSQAR